MPELACPTCPLCGQPPLYLFGGDQAWCGTPGCRAITWDPTVTAEENLANAHYVNLSEGRGDGPA